MRRILAATDFSSRSERALRRAGLLAKQFSAKLALLHVVDDDQPAHQIEIAKNSSEILLKEQAQTLPELQGIDCQILIIAADPFDGILRAADNTSADLVVMGTHRKQLLRDIFVGTTIERVIRMGSRPVLMVNREAKEPYRRAIAAVDISEASAHALKTSHELGLLDSVDLTIVHAYVATARTTMYLGGAKQSEIDKYVLDEGDKARAELQALLQVTGLDGKSRSYRVGEGDPYEVISSAAQETMSDLAIIGTHGRTGIAKVLLGSVAERVLYKLDTDILAVPPKKTG